MHVAAWYRVTPDQSSENSGNKWQLARSLMVPNFVTLQKEVSEISAPGKVDRSSRKSIKICYASTPLTVPNFTTLGQTMYKKSITKNFIDFNILVPRVPQDQSSPIPTLMYCKSSSINLPNFIPL